MKLFLVVLAIFLVAVLLMAVGVIFGRRRIQGSCGGLAGMRDRTGRTMCEVCSDPSPDCAGIEAKQAALQEDAERDEDEEYARRR